MRTIEAPRGGYVLVPIRGDWGERVRLYLGRCPVTNEEYMRYATAAPGALPRFSDEPGFDDPRQPVVGVSWHAAMAYCRWAGLSLPTEAQWQAACERGAPRPPGWHAETSGGRLHRVGEGPPDSAGLHDMLGNVWEWCLDEVEEPMTDDTIVTSAARYVAKQHVARGGAWCSAPSRVTPRSRVVLDGALSGRDVGFRPVLIEAG